MQSFMDTVVKKSAFLPRKVDFFYSISTKVGDSHGMNTGLSPLALSGRGVSREQITMLASMDAVNGVMYLELNFQSEFPFLLSVLL